MKYTLCSGISLSIPDCQNEENAAKLGNRASFHSKANEDFPFVSQSKKKPMSMAKLRKVSKQGSLGNKDDSATANASKWNYEDEYKFYLENSMKRKLRSSDKSQLQKLREIRQEKSTLLPQSTANGISTVPTHLKTDLSGNFNGVLMNGQVVLEKLPTSIFQSDPKFINSKKSKLKSSTISRINRDSKSNIKLTSLQLVKLQLRSKPVVTLNKTIVENYLAAKRVIQKILRSDQ